jgi:hydroxypyruvate isomerase
LRRREFMGSLAGAAFAASPALTSTFEQPSPDTSEADGVPFSLSVMLWTVFQSLPFERRLEKVREAGYHAVELVDEFKDWTDADFASARRKKRDLALEFDATAGVWHTLADANDREPFLKSLKEFIPILNKLECSRLILQSGDVVPGLSREQMRANCIETLRRAADIAVANKIEILVENIDPEENPKYFVTSSAEGFEMIRSVGNPHIKFLYDFFHQQIAEGNLITNLQKNLDVIGLLHVADVPGRHEPGTGEINYPVIFRKLSELGYNGFVAMEFKPLGDVVPALRAAREMALSNGRTKKKSAASQANFRRSHAAS